MIDAEKIRTEENPYLREVLSMGYDKVVESPSEGVILLCRSEDGYVKKVSKFEYGGYFTIKRTQRIGPDSLDQPGGWWYYISEVDGSADKFRELIKPEKTKQ